MTTLPVGTCSGLSAFIAIEGLDGAGTTTQARLLSLALTAEGYTTHLTREPSDGPIGRLLREMLTGQHVPQDGHFDPATLALLFAADRLDHDQREITPPLLLGTHRTVVISDRYVHSSLVYQGLDCDLPWLCTINQWAVRPTLTIFLRIRAEIAAARRHAAGRAQELFEDLNTQQRVAAGYETVMARCLEEGDAVTFLDGELPLEEVTRQVKEAALTVLRPG